MYTNLSDIPYDFDITELEARAMNILRKLGISTAHIGSYYLIKAIEIVYHDPSVATYVTKTLIPAVGKACRARPICVHRAILRVIAVLKGNSDRQAKRKYLGTETPEIDIVGIIRKIVEYLHREDENK